MRLPNLFNGARFSPEPWSSYPLVIPAFVGEDWTGNEQDWDYFHPENADYLQVWTQRNQTSYLMRIKALRIVRSFCLESIWLLTEQCPLLLHLILMKALWSRSARCCYFSTLQIKKLSTELILWPEILKVFGRAGVVWRSRHSTQSPAKVLSQAAK